jgi:hypothetical protein
MAGNGSFLPRTWLAAKPIEAEAATATGVSQVKAVAVSKSAEPGATGNERRGLGLRDLREASRRLAA